MSGNSIHAVTVTLNPDEAFRARLESYLFQVGRVTIVDNSAEESSVLDALGAAHGGQLEVIRNGRNLGLAAAQNFGVARALEEGAEWIAFFDDDSRAAPDMIRQLLAAYEAYPRKQRVGLLAPVVEDVNSGGEGRFLLRWPLGVYRTRLKHRAMTDRALCVISSGSLLRADVWRQCGFLREDYFIDWVDIEYCLRLHRAGFLILAVKDARLFHALGRKTTQKAAGISFTASNHPAWRRYTMYRNRVDVWKRYGLRFPAYVAYDMLVAAYEALKILRFEKDRAAKFAQIARGLRDGILGRFPLPF